MTLTIKIKMDNAAFEGDSGTEVARILRELAGRMAGEQLSKGDCRPLRDLNGNRVGEMRTTRR